MKLLVLIAFSLLSSTTPIANAQLFKSSAEISRDAKSLRKQNPKYVLAYGKVIAKKLPSGTTRFEYTNGVLSKEIRPDGKTGTYLYNTEGKFQYLYYSDGTTIYPELDNHGKIIGLKSNYNVSVRFKGKKRVLGVNRRGLASFLAIQDGITAMGSDRDVCTSDNPTPCVVDVEGPEDGGEGGGGWGGGIGGGGGGGGGGGDWEGGGGEPSEPPNYPNTGTQYPTTEECIQEVCEDSRAQMEAICRYLAAPPNQYARCMGKSMEYFARCISSCRTGDWSWLTNWNYSW